jgi:hypothetical protein
LVGEAFEVRVQVDRDLTTVSRVDRRLRLIKNLGRHTDYRGDDADDPTSDRFLEVYLLWLFGWVLFCESVGDSVSQYMIPWAQRIAVAPLEQMPQISRGSAVLAATYRGRCSVVSRPASREAILLGCPLMLQMWIHKRFDIGRPRADLSEYEPLPDGTDGPPHHGFSVVPPEGNDLPYRFLRVMRLLV